MISIPVPVLIILIAAVIIGSAVWVGRQLRAVGEAEDRYDQRMRELEQLKVERQFFVYYVRDDDPAPAPARPLRVTKKVGMKWRSKDGVEVEW
jgi:hypothetical protein